MPRDGRYDSMQHAVYETDAAALRVFRTECPSWEEMSVEQRERYGLHLLALTVADRWVARDAGG